MPKIKTTKSSRIFELHNKYFYQKTFELIFAVAEVHTCMLILYLSSWSFALPHWVLAKLIELVALKMHNAATMKVFVLQLIKK